MKKYFLLIFIFTIRQTFAVSLPHIFSDNMVLEQNSKVSVWGFAKAGENIAVVASWNEKDTLKTIADNLGKWKLLLQTPAGSYTPYTVSITGYNRIVFKNVLVGEVWFCSGQSNMEMSANWGINNKDEEIRNAEYPNIRLFKTDYRTAEYPQQDLGGEWQVCTPETMQNFSAIAYFFARDIQAKLKVPIGVICSAWGGTYIESWAPNEIFINHPFLAEGATKIPPVEWGPNRTSVLFNAMVNPIIPYKIAGVLWYQGEQNTANPQYYKEMLTALITSWRKNWNDNFPFYFAQIAPYNYGKGTAGVEIRNAQLQVAETVPNTKMIMTGDLCTVDNIHPKDKQDVGLRFANTALYNIYIPNIDSLYTPLPTDFLVNKNKVVISFSNGYGLRFKPKNNHLFELAGADGVYYPAVAVIEKNKIEVSSAQVKNPVKLRYAWSNTALPDLFNGAGLPVSSFEKEMSE